MEYFRRDPRLLITATMFRVRDLYIRMIHSSTDGIYLCVSNAYFLHSRSASQHTVTLRQKAVRQQP